MCVVVLVLCVVCIDCCLLIDARCVSFGVCRALLSLVVWYVVFCCVLYVDWSVVLGFVVCSILFVVGCELLVVRCVFCVVCCLFVVGWLVRCVWCLVFCALLVGGRVLFDVC